MMMNVKVTSEFMGYSGPTKINDEIIQKKDELKKSYELLNIENPS